MKDFDKTLINLKILSKIKEDTKLRQVNDGVLDLEKINFYTSVRRFVSNESRYTAVKNINDVIDSTMEKCESILNSRIFTRKIMNINDSFILSKIDDEYTNNYKTLELIYNDLVLLPDAFINLKKIYFTDKKICSNLDLLTSKVYLYLHKLDRVLKPSTESVFNSDIAV